MMCTVQTRMFIPVSGGTLNFANIWEARLEVFTAMKIGVVVF